jgi:hypothetical protein
MTTTITITHTRPEGTIATGTSKGDGSARILKAAGFRWGYSIGAWYIQQSRDRAAHTWKIDGAAAGLRAAGFDVDVSIDETPRAFAETEAEREARAEQRADTYADRAGRAEGNAAAAYQRFKQILEVIPPGQPILVGHHSERGHRAALRRADNAIRRSSEETGKAEHYQHRAETSGDYKARRESLGTTLRRIEKLEAERRKAERDMTPCRVSGKRVKPDGQGKTLDCRVCWNPITLGETVPEHGRRISAEHGQQLLDELDDQLTYWRKIVADQQADGAKVWGPADFRKGDEVLSWGGWRTVLRVNAKSLTVPSGYSWNDRVSYDDVRGRREASIPPTCILTGAEGENADDCTTHQHEQHV